MNRAGLDSFHPDDATLARAADLALFGASDLPTPAGADAARASLEQAAFDGLVALLACDERLATDAGAMPTAAPPTALVARLHTLAKAHRDGPAAASDAPPAPLSLPRAPRRDWLVAAASVAFGAAATWALLEAGRAGDGSAVADPARFLATHPSAVHWPWTPTTDDHVVTPVAGEAYFDPETGDGLLVIDGLAPNDPAREQYQLWIFDEGRDERFPVDGGVFDVDARGRTVVPVHAKLPVGRPTLLAVTIERPGGVVVSERRIALLARP